jgi:hypothetical protein
MDGTMFTCGLISDAISHTVPYLSMLMPQSVEQHGGRLNIGKNTKGRGRDLIQFISSSSRSTSQANTTTGYEMCHLTIILESSPES